MQYNHIFSLKKIRNTSLISTCIKLLIFFFVAFYIFYALQHKEDLDRSFKVSVISVFHTFGYWLLLPVLLFPLNWALEALKWQYLNRHIEQINFWRSFRGIFTGVTLGFVTPLGLGDYVGRIGQLESANRGKSIGAIFVSRLSQFYITLICGAITLAALARKPNTLNLFDEYFDLFLLLILLFSVLFIFLFLFYKKILQLFKSWKRFGRLYSYIEVIGEYKEREIAYVMFLSFLRYMVFTMQFILFLYFFGISSHAGLLFAGVNFIFLVKSVIPTFFDLGVRESAAIYFFSPFSTAFDHIVFASLSVWAVNILIPALIGAIFIFRLKIFTRP